VASMDADTPCASGHTYRDGATCGTGIPGDRGVLDICRGCRGMYANPTT